MNIKKFFTKKYGKKPTHIFDCGGRFEILGNHTDHNHGLCLAATASVAITCALAKRDDLIINIESLGFPKIKLDLSNFELNESENSSSAIIRGISKYFVDNGYEIGGFDAVLTSNIFIGAGVSSSAAFELLIGQIFNELFNGNKIDKITLAKAGQYAENFYFGKKSGLLDQISVAFGNIIKIDFKDIDNPKIEKIYFPFNDLMFVLVNTGGDHSLLNDLYSNIPIDMKSAAKKMGFNYLREASFEQLEKTKTLTKFEKDKAFHFFKENERVLKAIEALNAGDKVQFLNQINESRVSSTNYLKNMMIDNRYKGSPLEACDTAMKILSENGACKINGGGFAGSIICVVPKKILRKFLKTMNAKYGKNNVVQIYIREFGPRKIK